LTGFANSFTPWLDLEQAILAIPFSYPYPTPYRARSLARVLAVSVHFYRSNNPSAPSTTAVACLKPLPPRSLQVLVAFWFHDASVDVRRASALKDVVLPRLGDKGASVAAFHSPGPWHSKASPSQGGGALGDLHSRACRLHSTACHLHSKPAHLPRPHS